jgi:ubiquinone/menaquinone biosynthesis C-methylase UbiE
MAGKEVWEEGDAYEQYVGRWSVLVARDFLDWLGPAVGQSWLDVGCGTGALCAAIIERCAPTALVGVDRSPGFLATARARIADPRARFEQGDAQALPLEGGAFDVAVSGLVLNFVGNPGAMLGEMRRVLRPGGTVALYVWDYAEKMQLMRYFWDAAADLDPSARELDEGVRFPICRPEALTRMLRDAGLEAVATKPIDIHTVFQDFEGYWNPFLGGQGAAPAYCVSLSDERRAALRNRLQAVLPIEADGRIDLIARAIAVRGTVPAPRRQ